jgi:transcriptional regulator NrdR family protein
MARLSDQKFCCPNCKSRKLRALRTRDRGGECRRERECLDCGMQLHTAERIVAIKGIAKKRRGKCKRVVRFEDE